MRTIFDRLDTDGDLIVSKGDLVRALGASVTEVEIIDCFAQLGITGERLFFADFLRLITAQNEATTAGVRRKSIESKAAAALDDATCHRAAHGPKKRRPSLADVGRGLTLSDVVLQSEAEAAKAHMRALHAGPSWWAKRARSVQNLRVERGQNLN